ncbi:MAG: histidine kinase [Vicinamibacteria bacterium]|nr:histidine kinase [Vicinamibacteria bacterium]
MSTIVWQTYGLSEALVRLPFVERSRWPWAIAQGLLFGAVGLGFALLVSRSLSRRVHAAPLAVPWLWALPLAVAAGLGWLVVFRLGLAPLFRGPEGQLDLRAAPLAALRYVFVMLAWSAGSLAYLHQRRSRDLALAAARAEAVAREARLSELVRQLHPHFLFNTLASIRTLTVVDPRRAEAMVLDLSDFLRRTLELRTSRHALEDELALVRDQLAIEAVRLGDRLAWRIEVADGARRRLVPALVLLPLVENALKHGRAGPDGRWQVDVHAALTGTRLEVVIENHGDLASNGAGSTRLGLALVRAQLASLAPGATLALDAADGLVRATVSLRDCEEAR